MAHQADQTDARRFQAPRGTRDFYPPEMLRRRWIEQRWRQAAVRHGFEEIDGPRFERLDLYTVKSGEGIVSELFSFQRAGGEDRYALRPEFTPTLARMAAARAHSLPKPTKWFSVGPYFRAERPQRGRLREFLQWNVDILGSADDDEETRAQQDAELIRCCIDLLHDLKFDPATVQVRYSDRSIVCRILDAQGIEAARHEEALEFIDRTSKLDSQSARTEAERLGLSPELMELLRTDTHTSWDRDFFDIADRLGGFAEPLLDFRRKVGPEYEKWLQPEIGVVRGLAYYTGMVFEVHEATGKERAIAGGGRYDNLVELFGGPPTPAVGFAMGDVVLANVLQDKGLMPSDDELAAELGLQPDVFVISTGDEASEARLRPVVAELRRAGLHARHTYRSTRNVGKLLKEASGQNARFAAILEADGAATLKDLQSGEEVKGLADADLASRIPPAGPVQG